MNWVKVLWKEERMHSGKAWDGPNYGGKSTKGPGERQELKASRYTYNQEKIKLVLQNLKVLY